MSSGDSGRLLPAPSSCGPATPWLHRYALLLAGCTLFLIVAGAMVTSTGSGLAVPDWPTTYGQNMFTYPYSKWVGGIFYEHGHRLVASTVGLLTIGLALWLAVVERRRWLRRLGWLALAAVILQGVLGGLTVIYLLPTPISVFHGCLAQAFLCLVVSIAVFTSPRWVRRAPPIPTPGSWPVPRLCTAMAAVVFLQLLFGAIMRHTGSGLAVPDFPTAYGRLVPDLGAAALDQYNHDRRWVYRLPEVSSAQIAWHMLHRGGAVLVAAVLIPSLWILLRRHGEHPGLRWPALLALLLLLAQIGLGAWTVWSGRSPVIASAHVAAGAALLADTWLLTLLSQRLLRVEAEPVCPLVAVGGAAA
jgi:cytochrome c oxidase assembly protein subunit 15